MFSRVRREAQGLQASPQAVNEPRRLTLSFASLFPLHASTITIFSLSHQHLSLSLSRCRVTVLYAALRL